MLLEKSRCGAGDWTARAAAVITYDLPQDSGSWPGDGEIVGGSQYEVGMWCVAGTATAPQPLGADSSIRGCPSHWAWSGWLGAARGC